MEKKTEQKSSIIHDRFCELLTATDFELISGMMCGCLQRNGRQQTTTTPRLPPLPRGKR